ncbi:hypothetical protein SAMN04487996_102313 [Dyadobacter soli]|uniref:Sialate O-acetylesterase domain-containing protein n=1 Tax=Dyadobacter soli TaxID=659014 RepID=A0A1G6Y0M7_9BACT|nr:hypothetical protein [Dyadobacter soli]SDD83860.1 hypothetical protein SAMN04487996_102313 [Dyadobacter soli]
MKIFIVCIFACTYLLTNTCNAQTVSLSYPINNSVLQRGTFNDAVVTFAGQLVHNTLAVNLGYRIRSVSATGVVGAPGAVTSLNMADNGMFYTTQVINKGWYSVEILLNGVVYASAKFGIRDVFIIAGQSNAQGVENPNYLLPSGSGIPEWIVGTSENKSCTKTFPASFTSMFSLNTPDEAKRHGRLGPSGNTIWAYATLGKLISGENGGMPVAFLTQQRQDQASPNGNRALMVSKPNILTQARKSV